MRTYPKALWRCSLRFFWLPRSAAVQLLSMAGLASHVRQRPCQTGRTQRILCPAQALIFPLTLAQAAPALSADREVLLDCAPYAEDECRRDHRNRPVHDPKQLR